MVNQYSVDFKLKIVKMVIDENISKKVKTKKMV